MKNLARQVACGAALAVSLASAQAAASPNILLVIADDMGVDVSPCHTRAPQAASMPTLEALCRTGMVFDQAHVAPTCSPTRAMMLTGRYPSETGVGGAVSPRNPVGLDPAMPSVFDILSRDAPGYASALIGKWHLTPDRRDTDHPADLGVPMHFGPLTGALDSFMKWEAVDAGRSVPVSGYATTVLTDRAIDWIAGQTGPWFLWLAHVAPHTPFHAPPAALVEGDLRDDPQVIQRDPAPYYRAALEALDAELGRLLDSLGAAERANTVVLFIGDNGTPARVAGPDSRTRGAKGSILPGGTHVPLVVAGPGIAHGRSAQPVAATDLFATILDLAGAGGARPASSYSLMPVLAGRGPSGRDAAYVEHFGDSPIRGRGSYGWSVVTADHALVARDGQAPELYDLQADPDLGRDLLASGVPGAQATASALMALRAEYLGR